MTSLIPSPKSVFPILFTLVLACNPAPEQNAESGRNAATPVNADTVVQADNQTSVALPKFKITKQFLVDLFNSDPQSINAIKFIVQVKFMDGFSQPGNMHLLAFPASSHREYARNKTPFEITETDGTENIEMKEIAFANMELNWKKIKPLIWERSGPNPDFSHLLLTPFINSNKQLGYRLTIYDASLKEMSADSTGSQLLMTGFNLNPSPPAEPNE